MEETSTKLKDLELLQNSVNSTQTPGRRGHGGWKKQIPVGRAGKESTVQNQFDSVQVL